MVGGQFIDIHRGIVSATLLPDQAITAQTGVAQPDKTIAGLQDFCLAKGLLILSIKLHPGSVILGAG